ncbi:hypothetical protein HQ531_03555 [bacterium]|nr:hypothetical protein [bacterium]
MAFQGKNKPAIIRKGSEVFMKASSGAWSVDGATDAVGYIDQTQTVLKEEPIAIKDENARDEIIGYNVNPSFTMLQSDPAATKELETLDGLRGVDVDIVFAVDGSWLVIEDVRMSGERETTLKPGENRPINVKAMAEKSVAEWGTDVNWVAATPFPAA